MPKHGMENTSITETKKSTKVIYPSEDKADLFFYHNGIVHSLFLEQCQILNQHCYLKILARLHEAVHHRRTELWPDA
jgi:hypothetical protein